MIDIPMPPPAYVAPAPQTMIELRLPAGTVDWVCRMLGVRAAAGQRVYGCSSWQIGGCLIIVPKVGGEIAPIDQWMVREHEMAHCNGWPASHPH